MHRHLYLILSLWTALPLLAQEPTKFEREYRLDTDDIPALAAAFIDSCDFSKKVRWYGEESEDGLSVEAKTKRGGMRYSIEFDTSGQIQDVEVLTPFPDLPTVVQDSICHQLNEHYERFRLLRIQRQWTAESIEVLQQLIQGSTPTMPYQRAYEIVVRARTETGTRWYEYLFDEQGQVLRQQAIIFRNTDNLDY